MLGYIADIDWWILGCLEMNKGCLSKHEQSIWCPQAFLHEA